MGGAIRRTDKRARLDVRASVRTISILDGKEMKYLSVLVLLLSGCAINDPGVVLPPSGSICTQTATSRCVEGSMRR